MLMLNPILFVSYREISKVGSQSCIHKALLNSGYDGSESRVHPWGLQANKCLAHLVRYPKGI